MATTNKGIYYPNNYSNVADVPEDMKKLAESVDTQISNLDTNKVDKVDGKGLSTNDYTNEDKAKLDSLENYDDTEITQEIEDIQAKDESQDTEIDKQSDLIQKLKDNCINVTTDEATSLQVQDASTLPAKLDVRGNQRQEAREGYNVLQNKLTSTTINGVAFTINEDKSITLNGTATNSIIANLLTGQYNDNDATSPLIIPDNITNYRLSGCPSGGSWSTYKLDIYAEDDELIATDLGEGANIQKESDTILNLLRVRIIVYAGAVLNNVTFYPMIIYGAENKPYEQYGASPSINYPSEIKAVGDNVNMFDKDNANKINATPSAGTIIESSNGKSFYLEIKPNTDYSISRKVVGQRFTASTTTQVPAVGVSTNQNVQNNTGNEIHIKAGENDKYLLVYYLYNDSENEEEILSSIKVEEGEEATAYSPHGQGSVEVKKINKNWVKIDTPRTVERGGLSITLDDEGVFTINGTSTANIYINLINIGEYQNTTLTNYKLPLKKYKAYFDLIQKNNSAVSESNGDASFNIRNFAASSTGEQAISYCVFGGLIKGNTGVQIKDCNITDGRVVAYLYVANGVKLDNFKFRFALYNEDETDTTYEKHEEQSLILDVQQPMLSGDYFVKEADGWKEVHGWNKEFFANIINNAIISSNNMHMTIPNFSNNKALLPANSEIANIFSNVFKPIAFANIDKVDYGIGIYYASDSLVIRIKDCVTLEDYKNALNNEDFYFYYKLATSTKLPCTESQSNVLDQLNELELFKGTNNIITAESLALMQMQYIADTETYIDNRIDEKLANINQQLLEIVGGN